MRATLTSLNLHIHAGCYTARSVFVAPSPTAGREIGTNVDLRNMNKEPSNLETTKKNKI